MPIPFEQRVITSELVADESTARLKVNGSRPAYWTVRNSNALNKWNVPRAYRIMPMGTATTVVPDFSAMGFVAWTKYNLAFTQYHDDVCP
jgi:Cu2+-containing amine oxidase